MEPNDNQSSSQNASYRLFRPIRNGRFVAQSRRPNPPPWKGNTPRTLNIARAAAGVNTFPFAAPVSGAARSLSSRSAVGHSTQGMTKPKLPPASSRRDRPRAMRGGQEAGHSHWP
jgi:hypothetical protein